MIPQGWTEVPQLSQLTGATVFTAKPWDWQATAFAAPEGNEFYPDPYIMLRPVRAKWLMRSLEPKRRPTTWQAMGWATLANEYAHITGQDVTDVGGWSGGMKHWPTIRRLMLELMTKANVPQAKRKQLVMLARRTV